MITNVDLRESADKAQYQQSLEMLKYNEKSAYSNTKIKNLIIKKFSQENILAVISHYDEWILYGLTPDDILDIVQQHGEKGVELLNTLNAFAEELLNLTDTHVSINHFKIILDILELDAFFLIKFLLKNNDSIYFEALRTLVVWIKSLLDESSDARNGKFFWSQILIFLDITTYCFINIMSNIGPSRAIKIIQQLLPSINKCSSKSGKLISFKKISTLDFNAERVMLIIEKVGHVKEIENLRLVPSWSRTLSSYNLLSSVKSEQKGKYKNSLDVALNILGINKEQLVTILLSDNGFINFKLLCSLMLWIKTIASKDPKVFFAKILGVFDINLEQLIKIMSNIDNLNDVTNLNCLKDLKSLKSLSILLCWIEKLSNESNFTVSPKDFYNRILTTSNLTLEALLNELAIRCYENNVKIFKDLIQWGIYVSSNIDLTEALVILGYSKDYKLNRMEINDSKKLKKLKDSSLEDLSLDLGINIEELSAWKEPANPETFLTLTYDVSEDEPLDIEEAISSWHKLNTDNKQSKKRKAQKAALDIEQNITGCSDSSKRMTLFGPKSCSDAAQGPKSSPEKKPSRKRKAEKAVLGNELLHNSPNFSSNCRLDFFSGGEHKRRLTENICSLTEDDSSMTEFVAYWGIDREEDDEKEISFAHSSGNSFG